MNKFNVTKLSVFGAIVALLVGFTATGRALLNRCSRYVNEQKSVELLLEEAKVQLESDTKLVRESSREYQHLQQKLKSMQRQRGVRSQQRDKDRLTLSFIRTQLAKAGDVVLVSSGMTVERSAIEQDADAFLELCQRHDAAVKQFDAAIGTMSGQMRNAKSAINEATTRLRDDRGKLRQLQVRASTYRLQNRIAKLVEKATPDAILQNERSFDRSVSLANEKIDQLTTPRPMALAARWTELAHGQTPSSGETLVSDIDKYLANSGGARQK